MANKLSLLYPVIVEGKYDVQKLKNIVSSPIIELGGFSVFNNAQKKLLLKKLSQNGVIVLTDSDKAGHFIRSHIRPYLDSAKTVNLYIPCVSGKEKRKSSPSADGLIGVEGMDEGVLYDLLKPYETTEIKHCGIDKMTFYRDGLSGGKDSAAKRDRLAIELGLPKGLTANALIQAIDMTVTKEQYSAALEKI